MIKILIKEVNPDGDCENLNNYKVSYQSTDKVPDKYKEYVNSIKPQSENIKKIFKQIDL